MSPVTVGNAAEITGDPIEARYTTRRGYRAAVSASEGTYAPQEPGGAPRGVETDPGEALEVLCPGPDTGRPYQEGPELSNTLGLKTDGKIPPSATVTEARGKREDNNGGEKSEKEHLHIERFLTQKKWEGISPPQEYEGGLASLKDGQSKETGIIILYASGQGEDD